MTACTACVQQNNKYVFNHLFHVSEGGRRRKRRRK